MILCATPFFAMGAASEGSLTQALLLTVSQLIDLAEKASQRASLTFLEIIKVK